MGPAQPLSADPATADRRRGAALAWLALAVLLAGAHAWMASRVPMRFDASALQDEALLLLQARHILAGEWLGPYGPMTLSRGPVFQLWLAFVHLLGLPVTVAASLGWAAACGLLYRALAPALPRRGARATIAAATLFLPESLGDFNLLRDLLYPTWVLVMTAAAIGLLLRVALRDASTTPDPARRARPWAFALGLGSAAFVGTREEWVLALPLWLVVGVVLVAPALAAALRRIRRRPGGVSDLQASAGAGVLLAITVVSAALPLLAFTALNRHHYGVWTLVELNSQPFTAAFGALARVRHDARLPHVPVPSQTWAPIAAVSPAFAELKPRLEASGGAFGPSASGFGRALEADPAVRRWLAAQLDVDVPAPAPGDGAGWMRRRFADDAAFRSALVAYLGGARSAEAFLSGEMDREIGGSLFVWVLRDAAAAAGHHRDAPGAERFYRRLAHEVNSACADGRLACRGARASLAPPFTRTHRHEWPAAMVMATRASLMSENHTTSVDAGALGDAALRAEAQRFLRQPLAPPNATTAPVQPLEALIQAGRVLLPAGVVVALGLWLWLAPAAWRGWRCLHGAAAAAPVTDLPPPRTPATLRTLPSSTVLWTVWALAALVLTLVLLRLGVIALIHVSSWPAALNVRYLAPTQPLWMAFIALVVTGAGAAASARTASAAEPARAP